MLAYAGTMFTSSVKLAGLLLVLGAVAAAVILGLGLIEPGFRLDARVGYRTENGRWRITLWGKNLTDREYFRATTSVNQVYASPPLTVGVDVGFNFN